MTSFEPNQKIKESIKMNQFVTNTNNIIRGKYHPEFLQHEVLADIFVHTAQTLPDKTALIGSR